MQMNIVTFPANAIFNAANDDRPTGPGGNVVSLHDMRRRARVVRTLRGVFFLPGQTGLAQVA